MSEYTSDNGRNEEGNMELFEYEKQHLQTLRQSLAECTVLLRSSGDFPL